MKKLLLSLVLVSVASPAFAATQQAVAGACMAFWNDTINGGIPVSHQDKFRQMCDCQANAVMGAGLDPAAIDQWVAFTGGQSVGIAQAADITPVTNVFDAAGESCESQVK